MPRRQRADVDFVRLSLRLREGLRRRLAAAAQNNKTTLNGEILDRLEASFSHEATEARLRKERRAMLQNAGMKEVLEGVREMANVLPRLEEFSGILSRLFEVLERNKHASLIAGSRESGPDN